MRSPLLLLRLEGPLQSWGTRSRWSRRDTGPEPTKSAIIGMLGCAAGIRRPDWRANGEPVRTLEEWDRDLRFGVRVDRPGVIETDYHTVQGRHWQADGKMKTASSVGGAKPERAMREPPHTEVTWRDYLHDAAFVVALASSNQDLLQEVEVHLMKPKWPLYLGRKSCIPSRPILDRLTDEYPRLEDALRTEAWSAPRAFAKLRCFVQRGPHEPCPTCRKHGPPKELTAWIEDPEGDFEREDALRLNQLRFYEFRRCGRVAIPTAELAWSVS